MKAVIFGFLGLLFFFSRLLLEKFQKTQKFPKIQRCLRLDTQQDKEDFLEEDDMGENKDSATDRIRNSIDVATQLVISSRNTAAHLEDMKMQTRNFYGVILAAILVLFFTSNQDLKIGLIATFILLGLYALDVSLADLIRRFSNVVQKYERTLAKLVILKPAHHQTTKLNYFLDALILPERMRIRVWRKALNAIAPDLEQFIFYFVPLGTLIWFIV